MTYRDDRDALRAKSELLAEENEELRRKLEESQAALAMQAKDRRDEAALARPPGTPPGTRFNAYTVLALIVLALAGGIVYFVWLRGPL